MAEANWQIVSPDQSAQILRTIGTSADSSIFSKHMTEITFSTLPFYSKFKLFRLTNYATMPCFTMDYLGDIENETFYTLDGLANTLYNVNDDDEIALTLENVAPYLDFFFKNVQAPDGDIFLIQSPSDFAAIDSLPKAQQNSIREHHVPLTATALENKDINVHATVFYAGSLISADVLVSPSGLISIHNQQLLLHGIQLPMDDLNHHSYIEG